MKVDDNTTYEYFVAYGSYPEVNKQARSKSITVTTPKTYEDIPITFDLYSYAPPSTSYLIYELDGFGNQVNGFDTVPGHFGGVDHEAEDIAIDSVDNTTMGYKYRKVTLTIPKKWEYEADKLSIKESKYINGLFYVFQANKAIQVYLM